MTAPPEKLIALRFSRLDTEEGSDVIRVYDGDAETAADEMKFFGYETATAAAGSAPADSTSSRVSVSDAVSDAGKKKLGEFSGEYNGGRLNKIGLNNVGEVISSGPTMLLTFASDGSSQRRGFEATWELRDNPNMLVVDSDLSDWRLERFGDSAIPTGDWRLERLARSSRFARAPSPASSPSPSSSGGERTRRTIT